MTPRSQDSLEGQREPAFDPECIVRPTPPVRYPSQQRSCQEGGVTPCGSPPGAVDCYRITFEKAAVGIAHVSATGRFLRVNPWLCDLLGYRREELLEMTFQDITHPEDLETDLAYVRQMLAKERSTYQMEKRYRHKNGEYIWIKLSATLVDERDSRSRCFIAIIESIDARKRAEAALEESEGRYFHLLDSLPQKVFYKDCAGVYLAANRSYAREFGLEPQELMGKTDMDLYPPELASKYQVDDAEIINSRVTSDYEEKYVVEGREYTVHTVKSPVVDHRGEVVGVLGIFWDITDLRRYAEQLEQANTNLKKSNKELEEFAYAVSHDLKSPLVTFLGFLGLMEGQLEKQDLGGIRDSVDRMHHAAGRMRQIIDDILEISRIGRVVHPPEIVDLVELVEEVRELNAHQLQEKSITLTVLPDPPRLLLDKHRMRQVVRNLVGNAMKYGCEAGRHNRVEIGWEKTEREVRFYVRDEGPGIDPEYQDKIFGIFQRLIPGHEGSGVGLTIVKRAVECQKGQIWVESAPGQGATFWVAFPKRLMVKDTS